MQSNEEQNWPSSYDQVPIWKPNQTAHPTTQTPISTQPKEPLFKIVFALQPLSQNNPDLNGLFVEVSNLSSRQISLFSAQFNSNDFYHEFDDINQTWKVWIDYDKYQQKQTQLFKEQIKEVKKNKGVLLRDDQNAIKLPQTDTLRQQLFYKHAEEKTAVSSIISKIDTTIQELNQNKIDQEKSSFLSNKVYGIPLNSIVNDISLLEKLKSYIVALDKENQNLVDIDIDARFNKWNKENFPKLSTRKGRELVDELKTNKTISISNNNSSNGHHAMQTTSSTVPSRARFFTKKYLDNYSNIPDELKNGTYTDNQREFGLKIITRLNSEKNPLKISGLKAILLHILNSPGQSLADTLNSNVLAKEEETALKAKEWTCNYAGALYEDLKVRAEKEKNVFNVNKNATYINQLV